MGKKGDLSDFERGMVVGARRAGLSISKTADLYIYIYIYIYTHIYVYHLKYYTSDYIICAGEKNLCKNIKSCFIYILIKVNFEIVL